MRLARIKVHGFRKLTGADCNTPGKLLAFVGPNEAGKSSLLHALLSLQNSSEIPHQDRPRAHDVADDDVAIECWFRLDDADLEVISAFGSPVTPTWYLLSKKYGGGLIHSLDPAPARDLASRRTAAQALGRYAQVRAASGLPRRGDPEDDPLLGDHLDAVSDFADATDELTDDQVANIRSLVEGLQADDIAGLALRARHALQAWLADAEQPAPNTPACDAVYARRPRFALFGDAERTLQSDYALASVAEDPPPALANLATVAGLDLAALADAVERQDSGAYVTATEAANARLKEHFTEAWKQSPVVVRIHLDGPVLRVMVSNEEGGYSRIAERSDGLKSFVALTCFAAQEPSSRPLILLIDEAEQHLHFDAQADLIRMLDRQGLADQVLYTTHSPACLPADLGTGIRPVVPAEGGGRSTVTNAFWTQDRGFYPLLMALGAGAAAFAPTRYAVLTEGASDMLLLPSMLREATGRQGLDYQVAPGISESSWSQLLALELEAPRVVYLVDGDGGGANHAKRLAAANVPPSRIIILGGQGSNAIPEDLLREDVYLSAVNEVLQRVNPSTKDKVKASDIAGGQRPTKVRLWCEARALAEPSKTAVASMILEQASPTILTAASRKALKGTHAVLCKGLQIPP
jgi:predicted ATP-dependent endonuclease of OLD family